MSGLIAGQVIDSAGQAVAGTSVAISAGPGPWSDISALTNAEGRFRLGNLAPGTYTVTALAPGQAPVNARVTVRDRQQSEAVLRVGG